jgi:hypothetical protein
MNSASYPINRKPRGYRQQTVADTALALSAFTGGIPTGITYVKIVVETNGVRWRDDGVAPTTTVGMLAAATTNREIELFSNEQIRNFRIIRDGASSAVVSVSYYSAAKAY